MDKKILVVHHEIDIILVLMSGLEENGFIVDSYNDPKLTKKVSKLIIMI